jgi:hypothetical protein
MNLSVAQDTARHIGFDLGYKHDYSELKRMSVKAAAQLLATQRYTDPCYQREFTTAYRRGCRRARAARRYVGSVQIGTRESEASR